MAEEFAGRYRLENRVGDGGMGEVWSAYDLKTRRKVALKRLPAPVASDSKVKARFRRECARAATLDHPHIARTYDFGEAEGQLYLAMQFIEGDPLSKLVETLGALAPLRAVRIVEQVAGALDSAHATLVHRDIKPANIMVAQYDTEFAYLIDFGISSTVSGSSADHRLTDEGFIVGTFDYAAPERFEDAPASVQMDVYSLACVLYEALTGQVPFPVEGVHRKMTAHVHEKPPAASARNNAVPAALDKVIARGMAKEPSARYSTTGDLALAARAALIPTRSSASASSPAVDADATSPPKSRPQASSRPQPSQRRPSQKRPDPTKVDAARATSKAVRATRAGRGRGAGERQGV